MAVTTPDVFKPTDVLAETISDRRIGWLERTLGPENYRLVRGLVRTPASIMGLSLIILFAIVALAAPLIAPPVTDADPYMIPRDGFLQVPQPAGSPWTFGDQPPVTFWMKALGMTTWTHVLGTSQGQYDIFYGIIWGTRTAFKTGIFVTFITVLLGLAVGSIAAYYGGAIDNILMRIVDVFLTLPYILAALILAAVLIPKMGRSLWPTMFALIGFGWMGYSRLIRGDILSVRERDYVLAARVIGVKDSRILIRHIIPNAVFPTLVLASLSIGGVVLDFAALSFLGIGAPEGYADWGQLLSFARNWITDLGHYWYILLWPGLILVLFVLGWNLLGDAMRDILDPKMRGRS